MKIPYYALDLSDAIIDRLENDPAPHERMALATGSLCSSDKERIGLCVLLASDEDNFVAKTAKRTLSSWDEKRIIDSLHRQTHAKVLEYVVEFLTYSEALDEQIFSCVNLNERTALLITGRASSKTCEEISRNRQQLLLTPDIFHALRDNEQCPPEVVSRVESFLKMQHALPSAENKSKEKATAVGPDPNLDIDISAEVSAFLKDSRVLILLLPIFCFYYSITVLIFTHSKITKHSASISIRK